MSEANLKTKTAKGLFWGGMNNGLQQLIGVVVGLVLLSRLSPDDYGIVGMLAIFTAIATTMQEGGFKAALINRGEIRAEDHNSVFWFTIAVSACLYLILFFLAEPIARFYNQPELVKVARLLFLSFFFVSCSISSDAYLLRKMMIRQRAAMDISGALIAGIVAVVMAIKGFGYWALVAHSVVQSFVTSLLKVLFTPWKPNFKICFKPVWEMFPFGFRLVAASFVTQIQNNIFSVILGRAYSKTEVGVYTQGSKWANMANQVFSGMVTSVGQPVLAVARDDADRRRAIFRKLTRFVAFAAFPAMLGLGLIAPEFINLINPEFAPSVPILRIYCLYFMATLVQTLFNQAAMAAGRSDRFLTFTLINAAVQIATAFLTYSFGLVTMAAAVTAANYLAVVVWYLLSRDIIGVRFIDLLKDTVPFFAIALLLVTLAHFAFAAIGSDLLRMLLKIAFVAGLYLTFTQRTATFKDVMAFIKKREL
ncbi:MAG: lipopolysaccharide biosynthesis protein [Bacteroidales bacterium]|nr:lipopolysaccharide biosynthesis protein [Bacteroidales bacterium]